MTRTAEAGLIVAASFVAAIGVAIVEFTQGSWLNAQVAVTLTVFLVGFGSVHLAVRTWASGASSLLLPIVAFLTAIGFVEIYRIDPSLAGLQRFSLLLACAAAAGTLWVLRSSGVAILRRYRYVALAAAVFLLMLPLLPDSSPLSGATVNGSRLWVRLEIPTVDRVFSFQPGEIAKILIVIFLASYLAERADALAQVDRKVGPFRIPEPRNLAPILIAAQSGRKTIDQALYASAFPRSCTVPG